MTTHAAPIDGATTNLIGVVAAARELGLHHSTVSRFVKSHPNLNRGSEKRPKIDVEEYRRHHADFTNPLRRESHAGRLFGEGGPAGAGPGAAGESREGPPTGREGDEKYKDPEPSKLVQLRETNLAEDVARKRRDRLEAEGLLLPKAAVEAAFFSCARRVRRKIELIETWADELAAACGGDAGALRAALRERLQAFQTDIAETVAALPNDDDDADDDDADLEDEDAEDRAA